ncbi:MAG: hypothetical protein PV344_02390, partial [Anaplasma sp.]|nr:hypothetical protein [Anaplasma sp.]
MILNRVFIFMGKLTKIFKKKNKKSFPAEVGAGSPVSETLQSNASAETSPENVSQSLGNSPEEVAGYSVPFMYEAGLVPKSAIGGEDIENEK